MMKYNHEKKRMDFNRNEYYRFFISWYNEAASKARSYILYSEYDNPRYEDLEDIDFTGVVYEMSRATAAAREYLEAGGQRPIFKQLNELNRLLDSATNCHMNRCNFFKNLRDKYGK